GSGLMRHARLLLVYVPQASLAASFAFLAASFAASVAFTAAAFAASVAFAAVSLTVSVAFAGAAFTGAVAFTVALGACAYGSPGANESHSSTPELERLLMTAMAAITPPRLNSPITRFL